MTQTMTRNKLSIQQMAMCGLFTALIAIGAFIKIPVPVVPFTLQFFFTMMAGLLLGSRLGAISVAVYTALGLLGLPIFAEGGGIWYVFKPSFGYMLGFILATYVTGLIVEKKGVAKLKTVLAANFIGLFIVYAVGMAYFYVICNYVINAPIAVGPLFLYCFVLAVPGDICLCIIAGLVTKRMRPITDNLMR